MQSAYWKYRSTETALLCIQNDILEVIDGRRSVILVLLDVFAAFETTDHHILLHPSQFKFGITRKTAIDLYRGAAILFVLPYKYM